MQTECRRHPERFRCKGEKLGGSWKGIHVKQRIFFKQELALCLYAESKPVGREKLMMQEGGGSFLEQCP